MIATYTFYWCQVSMAFLLVFIWLFVPTRYSILHRILIMAVFYGGCTLIDYLRFFVLEEGSTSILIFQTVIETVLLQGSVFLLCKYKDFRALFAGLTAAVVFLAGSKVAVMVLLATHSFMLSVAGQILTNGIVIGLLICFARENWLVLLESSWKYWRELCVIPALFWLVVYALTIWPQNVWEGENYKNLFAVMLLLVLLEASYVVMLLGIGYQHHITEIERDNEYLETYANRLKMEADRLREQETETAVLRHDLRHYFAQIQAYLALGDLDEAQDVLRQIDHKMLEIKPKRYCDNLAVNGVITYCKMLAERDQVKLTTRIEVPQKLAVNEFEFATVISNLLENAVYAAAKVEEPEKRQVSITVRGVKGKMMLEIKNSYAKLPEISRDTGLPVSENGEGHGYGLKSVLAFARKNGAIVDYEVEEDIVCARMLV